jgi:cytoskeleton protein RodZ
LKRIPRQSDTGGFEAARLGEDLRDARLALGYSVDEMAAHLRIRRAHLDALEEGRLRDLPAPAYVLGFVRSYAGALGLDPDVAVLRYREVAGLAAAKPQLVFPEPKSDRGAAAGRLVAIGAVVAIGGYVAWFNLSGAGHRTVDVVPPVPPRLEAAVEQGRTQLAGRGDAGALPLAALPLPGGMAASGSSGANTSAQAATVPAAPATAIVPVAAVTPAPVAQPASVEIPGMPAGTRIALRARSGNPEGAWVQVRDSRAGSVILNRVLRPGEAWPVPARDGLILDTGKADGLEIIVDGQASPVLDGQVGVRRNIALDAERLRQRPASPGTASAATAPRN